MLFCWEILIILSFPSWHYSMYRPCTVVDSTVYTHHTSIISKAHNIALQLPKQHTAVCIWLFRQCSMNGLGECLSICITAVGEEVHITVHVPTKSPSARMHHAWIHTRLFKINEKHLFSLRCTHWTLESGPLVLALSYSFYLENKDGRKK